MQVSNFVEYRINSLANSNYESGVKATLAHLRRGVGKHPAANPSLWEATFSSFPSDLQGTGSEPSYGELAVHAALTLFATHQQSLDLKTQLMHELNISIGKALGLLAILKGSDSYDSIKKRFDRIVTADSLGELSNYLRGSIQLLRSNRIPLDYKLLAKQLYDFQFIDNRDAIRLSWGRDFYSAVSKKIDLNKGIDRKDG